MLSNFGSWNCSGKRPAHPGCGRRHDHDEPIRSCDQVLADHLLPRGSRWHRRLRGGLWIARWGVVGGWMLDRRRELLTTDQAALLERGGEPVLHQPERVWGLAAQHRGTQPAGDGSQLGELGDEDFLDLVGRRWDGGHARSRWAGGGPGPVRAWPWACLPTSAPTAVGRGPASRPGVAAGGGRGRCRRPGRRAAGWQAAQPATRTTRYRRAGRRWSPRVAAR